MLISPTPRSLFNQKDELQERIVNSIDLLSRTIDPIVSKIRQLKLKVKPDLASMVGGYIENIELFRQICNEEKKASVAEFFHRASSVAQCARSMAAEPKFIEVSGLLKDDVANLRNEIDSILNSISNREVSIDEDSLGQYFPGGDRKKIKTVEHRLKIVEAQLEKLENDSELVTGRALSASKMVDGLNDDVGSRLDAIIAGANKRLSNLSVEFDEKHQNLEDKYDEKKAILDSKVQELDKLMQIAARKALAGGYMRNALKEGKTASNFRWAAIALMCVTAYVVIMIVFLGNFIEINPMLILQKSLAFLFVTFIIAYLVRQAAVHRAQEQKYMQTALDLGALKPFVATLPEDVRNEILKEFAQKLFNPKDAVQVAETGFGVNELLGKFIDKLELPKEKSAK